MASGWKNLIIQIRNLNIELLEAEVFHLWAMTPQYIIEHFEYVFYLGNERGEREVCELNAIPETYYNDLVNRIMVKQE